MKLLLGLFSLGLAMGMTEAELDSNYYDACLKYANESEWGVDFQQFQSQIGLSQGALGHVVIDYWTHPAPEPDRETLRAYTLASLDPVKRVRTIAMNPQPALKPLTISDSKTVATQAWCPNFMMASNIDTNQPMIIISGIWYSIPISTIGPPPAPTTSVPTTTSTPLIQIGGLNLLDKHKEERKLQGDSMPLASSVLKNAKSLRRPSTIAEGDDEWDIVQDTTQTRSLEKVVAKAEAVKK